MIDVAAAVEVDHGLQGDLLGDGFGAGGGRGGLELAKLGGKVVEGRYVGIVMIFMVELHDFAGDRGFEGGIVVWDVFQLAVAFQRGENSHGRSGRVALPRAKVVLVVLAWERARKAERAVMGRRSVLDMMCCSVESSDEEAVGSC